jgi:hypothetical protein
VHDYVMKYNVNGQKNNVMQPSGLVIYLHQSQ